LAFKVGSSYWT